MRVDIWADIVCPWCYIGNARFSRALADFEHRDEVEVVYRPLPGAIAVAGEPFPRTTYTGTDRLRAPVLHAMVGR